VVGLISRIYLRAVMGIIVHNVLPAEQDPATFEEQTPVVSL
jgi:hypothetical protein